MERDADPVNHPTRKPFDISVEPHRGQVNCNVGPLVVQTETEVKTLVVVNAVLTFFRRRVPRIQHVVSRNSIYKLMAFGQNKTAAALSTSPCADLRIAYHNCFNRWYSEKFLKGQWDKQECVIEWKKYRDCLSQHLDDKHLSRFLEAEELFDLSQQTDSGKAAGDTS